MSLSEFYTCSCCDGHGKVDHYGSCPLCDGFGTDLDTRVANTAYSLHVAAIAKAIVHTDRQEVAAKDRPFSIGQVPGKGSGIIATRSIALGELLLSELPLMSVTGTEDLRALIATELSSSAQSDASSMRNLNTAVVRDERMNLLVADAFWQLDSEARSDFISLADSFVSSPNLCIGSIVMVTSVGKVGTVATIESESDGDCRFTIHVGSDEPRSLFADEETYELIGTLSGIFFTNAVNGRDGGDVSHLYVQSSRFNHSCTPNAIVNCGESNAREVFACRCILPGEEICISYAEDYSNACYSEFRAQLRSIADIAALPFEDLLLGLFRERVFAKWGFWCRCQRCAEASARADAVLARWHAL